jgi:hypothetical protein
MLKRYSDTMEKAKKAAIAKLEKIIRINLEEAQALMR